MDDRTTKRISGPPAAAGAAALVFLAALGGGCRTRSIDTHLDSPYPKTRVVAIAPFMNQSPSADVDPLVVSDLFFSELQRVRGFQVLPVNRTLQAMVALKMETLTGPGDALRLAEFLGADIIFVGAVTSYDPYDPPEVGLAVQLYALPESDLFAPAAGGKGGEGGLDPVALARAGRPFPIDPAAADPLRPRAQVNEIFNAGHEIVQKQIQEFADIREGSDSPLGWRIYVKSIRHYVRFCSFQAIRRVLDQEQGRMWVAAAGAGGP